MICFEQLNEISQGLTLTALFLNLCVGGVCLFIQYKRRHWAVGTLILGSFLINTTILTLFASGMRAALYHLPVPEAVEAMFGTPMSLVLSVTLATMVVEGLALIQEHVYRKNAITHSAIKESFDHLNTALCFSRPDGLILLTNHIMVRLGFSLTGEEMQNAAAFWETLKNGSIAAGAERLSYGETPEFRLADGSIWTFRREMLDDVVQLTAAETTQLHQLMETLRNENRELEALCQRIRDYGDKVDQYVITKERLETRVNLHSCLGQALLTTRHFIQYENGSMEQILGMWHRNIDVLKLEAEPQTDMDSFSELKANAQVVGIRVETTGVIPGEPAPKRLLALAGVEAVINAGKHGEARTVRIDIEETEQTYIARYTNDGRAPRGQIAEGGGLSSLRAKIERAGGEMRVQSTPEFVLTVILRKEETPYV